MFPDVALFDSKTLSHYLPLLPQNLLAAPSSMTITLENIFVYTFELSEANTNYSHSRNVISSVHPIVVYLAVGMKWPYWPKIILFLVFKSHKSPFQVTQQKSLKI